MFIHFGLYSKLGGIWKGKPIKNGYSEQIQMWANIIQEDYEAITDEFSIEKFNPKEIVSLAKEAGMNYIVITSKHHDGFCLFDTKTTDYNTVESTPFGKDILDILSKECKEQGIKFGIYYSLIDWKQGHEFNYDNNNKIPDSIMTTIKKQLTELMTNYGEIVEVWFDMSHPSLEQSELLSRIVRKHQPSAAINGRIWNNKGDFRTLKDNQIPLETLEGAWQTPASIYQETWGYRKWQNRENPIIKARTLLKNLISVRSRNGNYLLNIGPTGDGAIVNFEKSVLKIIGSWIKRHPNVVIGAHATQFIQQPWGEITVKGKILYLHIFEIPKNKKILLNGLMSTVKNVEEDGFDNILNWTQENDKLKIVFPENPNDNLLTTIKVELDEELILLPEKIIRLNDGRSTISTCDLYNSYNFIDEGDYGTLQKTNVKLTAYLHNSSDRPIYLDIEGKVNLQFNYSVQVGDEKKIVTGKRLLKNKIGPFFLEKDTEIVPLAFELYEPENKYQDIELDIDKIVIISN